MFGRLDEDPELEREYLIVSNYVNEDPIVFQVTATTDNVKEQIKAEIELFKNVGFSVYELVEFVEVYPDKEVIFIEDQHSLMKNLENPNDV